MIKSIMNSGVVTIKLEDTIKKALDIMNKKKINGTPVVNDERKLVGMLVKADIYRFLMEEGHYDTCPVDWVMTKKVITAKEDESIMEVAKRIRENDIIAIPIENKENKVIGIVSVEDLISYFIEKYQD
ncbi:arabinose 5-phosphate isomerase KpsF [Clostridium acetireducens DSM 10703]|uniref:Arabinose 5-phosphate isomerase KpsF n=1 Tax=Clostridium acetireducens DSM 10703 TaxID=1121290 RepID=A0A1E8EUV6_9CLOT|nr:CBS domain-containing protein [Clostridium acetireducens]OFH98019.1 arabinose 5-phosphate isomerase KpsF [Clostridium acetireducens DSM 10703]